MSEVQYPESDIAIVGMSGHFPGAPDPETLWTRIVAGDDCLVDLDRELLIADGVPPQVARSADYVARSGVLDRRRHVRPRVLRHRPPRRGDHGSAAPPLPRVRLGGARVGRLTCPSVSPGRSACSPAAARNTYMLNNLLTNPQLVEQVGWFLLRHTGNDKDFLTTTALVPARPARPEGQRADGVLDVARRRAPRRAEPARLRVRHGARRRRDDRGAARARLRVPRGRDPLARRGVPGVRCRLGGHGAHQRRGRRRPAPPRRMPSTTAIRSSPSSRARPSTTTAPARSATSPRASTATPTWSRRRSPSPASTPVRSACSRRTARAPRSATRSRSPRSPRRSGRPPTTPASAVSCRRSRTSVTSTRPPASPA